MRGGTSHTGKRTLPTRGPGGMLTQVAVEEYLEKTLSPSSTPSSKKDDQYNSDLSPEEEAKIEFNEQMKSHLNTRSIIKLREAILNTIPNMLENRNLQISVRKALASDHLTVDKIKKIINHNIKEIINDNVKVKIDDESIEEFVNNSITQIQNKL